MVKHFEELWEEAESVANQSPYGDDFADEARIQLHSEIDELCHENNSHENRSKSFGKILYLLCYLSFKWNVNTFVALLKETQDRKIDLMDD